jgi:hypothetical protein
MPINTTRIFPEIQNVSWGTLLTANTAKDGTGSVVTAFTAGASGSIIDQIKIMPLGTNIETVVRFFTNNGSTNETPANNTLIHEVKIPATTVSEVEAQGDIDVTIRKRPYYEVVCPIPFLPAGHKINVTTSKTIAAGLEVVVHGWNYSNDTTPMVSVGTPTGTAQVGEELTAGALDPLGATVDYQWSSCDTIDGTYVDIVGATNSTYTLVTGDIGKFIKVSVTGTGVYFGTVTSDATTEITGIPMVSVGTPTGTAQVGEELTAGALDPLGATILYYQWSSCDTVDGTYVDIVGANSSTYTLVTADIGKFIKVSVTGTGNYTGTVTSDATAQVIGISMVSVGIPVGVFKPGGELAAWELNPAEATVTYQWSSCDTVDGTYVDIVGATSDIYMLVTADIDKFIKVSVTGTGDYTGTVTSDATQKVTAIDMEYVDVPGGTAQVGEELTAYSFSPAEATVTYQWKSCDTVDGTYVDIVGATSDVYTVVLGDVDKYIKVSLTGTGNYTGTVTSGATEKVIA